MTRFKEIMQNAVCGDQYALQYLIEGYMPLITKHSMIDGEMDEDCRQFIIMRILSSIPNFRNYS